MLPILRYDWSHCENFLNNTTANQYIWWHVPDNLSCCFMNLIKAWPHPQSWPSVTLINLTTSSQIGVHKGWAGLWCNPPLIKNLSMPRQSWKTSGLVHYNCHPMALRFNLSHSFPGHALILNANMIHPLVKLPVSDGASERTDNISRAYIFGGSLTVQLRNNYYNTKGQHQCFAAGTKNFWIIISL